MDRTSELNEPLFLTSPVSPLSVHVEMWTKKVESALTDPLIIMLLCFTKYLCDASGNIFEADLWFYEHISSVPGYQNAF